MILYPRSKPPQNINLNDFELLDLFLITSERKKQVTRLETKLNCKSVDPTQENAVGTTLDENLTLFDGLVQVNRQIKKKNFSQINLGKENEVHELIAEEIRVIPVSELQKRKSFDLTNADLLNPFQLETAGNQQVLHNSDYTIPRKIEQTKTKSRKNFLSAVHNNSFLLEKIDMNQEIKSFERNKPPETIKRKKLVSNEKSGQNLDSIKRNDFLGIETFCRNAGSTSEGLSSLLVKIRSWSASSSSEVSSAVAKNYLVISILWKCSSSNHIPTTSKYCTPSVECHHWYCSCDRHIRAHHASRGVLGLLIMLSSQLDRLYYIPLDHNESQSSSANQQNLICQTSLTERWNAIIEIFSLPNVVKVFYHSQLGFIPIIQQSLQSHEPINVANLFQNVFDPRIAQYLCDSDVNESTLELNSLFQMYHITLPHPDMSGLGSIARRIKNTQAEMLGLMELYPRLHSKLSELDVFAIFSIVEMPIISILSEMELVGIQVSIGNLQKVRKQITNRIQECEGSIYQQSAQRFNISSPEQVSKVLYDVLKLPSPSTLSEKGKHRSTSEEELKKLIDFHPIVNQILTYRGLTKLLTTYIDGLNNFIESPSSSDTVQSHGFGSIHACWKATVVRTGRLSCCKPNLQNIPNHHVIDNVEYNIRSLFQARPGGLFISADYSQIEMRILAHLCGDEVMIELFRAGGDIYKQLASRIMNKKLPDVTDDERMKAKVICLGVLYGMGHQAAAAKLNIDINTTKHITESFFNHFKQMKHWIQQIKQQARKVGHIRTLLGRIRHLPDILSEDRIKSSMAERQAVNSVIQGTASDIMKYAMITMDKRLSAMNQSEESNRLSESKLARKLEVRLLMQIHDEVIFEMVDATMGKVEIFVKIMNDGMVDALCKEFHLKVPLTINIKTGQEWGNLQPYSNVSTNLV